jgi:uncharacterized membrane protein
MAQSSPLLDLKLTPHRALSRKGFIILMAVVAGICGLNAIRFAFVDAWPVVFFLLLDVALVYGAFKLSYWSGRRYERLRLEPAALTVEQVDPAGRARTVAFDPYWVRVEHERPSDIEDHLRLVSHGKRLEIGSFLAPVERDEVREMLEDGLAQLRR